MSNQAALPMWQQHLLDAYAATGRCYHVRRKKDGSKAVSLDGHRETNMAIALKKIETVLFG